jgi:hypothetical protein
MKNKMKRAELYKMQYDLFKESIITDIWLNLKSKDGEALDIMETKGIPAIVVNEIDDQMSETIDELIVRKNKVIAITTTNYDDVEEYNLNEFEVPMLIAILNSVEKHIELEDSK